MDTLLTIISCLTVAAQQASQRGDPWEPMLEMPQLFRKKHPSAAMILAALHTDTVELALLRVLPANEAQAPFLSPHVWFVVPVRDLETYKRDLARHLEELRAEFRDVHEALASSSQTVNEDDEDEEDEEDEETDVAL